MRRALLCLSVLGGVMAVCHTPCACGQQVVSTAPALVSYRPTSVGAHILGPYLSPSVPESSLANSPRLHELIRNGKMQLSLQDALALAIDNNLDIVVARYDPPMAQTDLLRAKAGGQPEASMGLSNPPRSFPAPPAAAWEEAEVEGAREEPSEAAAQ